MKFTLGLAQCRHPEDADPVALVDKYSRDASDASVDLLVFPESLMTPYEKELKRFLHDAEPVGGPFASSVCSIARDRHIDILFTMNELNPLGNPFNTAVFASSDGEILSIYRKVHLFDSNTTRESDRMSSGDSLPEPVRRPYGIISFGICYDLRFPEVARFASTHGAHMMIYPAAWVDGPRKIAQWETLLRARAIENDMFVAGLSRCDEGYIGHSCVFDPWGEPIAQASSEEQLLVAHIDTDANEAARAAIPVLEHLRPECY